MKQEQFEQQLKHYLHTRVEQIDTDTRQDLRVRRQLALSHLNKTPWYKVYHWMPMGGLALCSLIAVMLLLPSQQTANPSLQIDQTAMIELMEHPEDMDVLSDPGFYIWMEETTGT